MLILGQKFDVRNWRLTIPQVGGVWKNGGRVKRGSGKRGSGKRGTR